MVPELLNFARVPPGTQRTLADLVDALALQECGKLFWDRLRNNGDDDDDDDDDDKLRATGFKQKEKHITSPLLVKTLLLVSQIPSGNLTQSWTI